MAEKATRKKKNAATKEATENKVDETVVSEGNAEDVVAAEDNVDTTEAVDSSVNGEVVAEFTHQLGIFNTLIYNVRNEDATVIVENLGFGDIYVSDKETVRVGEESQRVLFKEQKVFKGVKKLFLISASQPVVSIIEVK